MQSIGEALSNPERSIRFDGGDILTRKGFTLVPNFLLNNSHLSAGAKLTYVMLLKYAWYENFCFPGQDQLASDMGVSRRYAQTCLKELEQSKLISVKRQGLGKPNVYTLHLRVDKFRPPAS